MKKIQAGILFGALAGLIDVLPMLAQKLSWDANLSAFLMWVAVGFLVSISDLKINGILKGLIIAFLVLLPTAILIGAKEPISLVPITVMTIILGSLIGFAIERFDGR